MTIDTSVYHLISSHPNRTAMLLYPAPHGPPPTTVKSVSKSTKNQILKPIKPIATKLSTLT